MVSVVVEANKKSSRSSLTGKESERERKREIERDESDLELRSLSITKKISFNAKSR